MAESKKKSVSKTKSTSKTKSASKPVSVSVTVNGNTYSDKLDTTKEIAQFFMTIPEPIIKTAADITFTRGERTFTRRVRVHTFRRMMNNRVAAEMVANNAQPLL